MRSNIACYSRVLAIRIFSFVVITCELQSKIVALAHDTRPKTVTPMICRCSSDGEGLNPDVIEEGDLEEFEHFNLDLFV